MPDHGKDFDRIVQGVTATVRGGIHDSGRRATKERIGGKFNRERAGNRWQPGCTPLPTGFGPGPDIGIVRLDRTCKLQVGLRIFMGAVNLRGHGQGSNLAQRSMHLGGCSFEQTATAGHEERVTDERHALPEVGNMSRRMSWNVHDLQGERQVWYIDAVAVVHGGSTSRNGFACRTEHGDPRIVEQCADTADVVGVVMRRDDGTQAEAMPPQVVPYGRRVTGVNHRGSSSAGIGQDPDVIVPECRDWFYGKHDSMLAAMPDDVNSAPPQGDNSNADFATTVMRPAGVRQRLAQWFSTDGGRHVLEGELLHLGQLLPAMFGYHLVQLGHLGSIDLLQASRIQHKVILQLDSESVARTTAAVTSAENLPLDADSVDVVVLPHVLEFADNPHKVLREPERVLIGEGHVVVQGFNPWGFWGIWRLLLGWREEPPWCGQFYGLARIRDWFALLDFEIVGVRRCAFCPPVRNARVRRWLAWLDKLGRRLLPGLCGVYIVVARKRVIPLTPVRSRWQTRRALMASGVTESSARECL